MDLKLFTEEFADLFEVDSSEMNGNFSLEDRWDSLAVIAAIALVDEHFGINVDGPSLTKCNNFSELITLLHSKQG
jgi:acyl carrier protein